MASYTVATFRLFVFRRRVEMIDSVVPRSIQQDVKFCGGITITLRSYKKRDKTT